MNKVLFVTLAIFMSLVYTGLPVGATDSLADQSSYVTPSSPAYAIADNGYCQGFTPNIDVTTSISVYIKNSVPGSELELKITDPIKVHALSKVNLGGGFKWENFRMDYAASNRALEKGRQYYLCLSAVEPTVTWSYASPGGYASGTATKDRIALASIDMGFITYGYNNIAPADDQPASDQPVSPAELSPQSPAAPTNQAPDNTTSTPSTDQDSPTNQGTSNTVNTVGNTAEDSLTSANEATTKERTRQSNVLDTDEPSWWQNWQYCIIAIILIVLVYVLYRLAKKKGLLTRVLFQKHHQ